MELIVAHDDHDSHEVLAEFIDTAPDAMIVVRRDGCIAMSNRRAEAMFDVEPGYLENRLVESLLPEAMGDLHRHHREVFWTDPTPRAMGAGRELVARRFDGTEFPVDVSLGLVDVAGEPHVAAAIRDITEQVEAKRALSFFSFIVASSQEAIYSLDADGRVSSWNRAAERLTGRRADEVIGERTSQPLGLIDPELERSLVERAQRGEQLDRVPTQLVRSDGTTVPVSLTLAAIRDHRGRVVGTSGIARDNTEEVLGQQMLAEVQDRIAETQRLARIGLWAYDVTSGEVQWSEELYNIAGVSPLEFGGDLESHLAIIGADDRDRVRAELHEAVTRREELVTEYPMIRPDGERRWIMSRGDVVIDDLGRVTAIQGICQDLTERQRLLEALQEADRLKDEFLGVVSHELRTPLTSIVGFSRLLGDRVGDDEKEWVEILLRNGKEMHGMIERILDFTRMQGGRVKLSVGVQEVEDLITHVMPSVADALAGHAVEVDVSTGSAVLADPSAFRRVLANLLTNAAKFSEGGTTIRLSVRDDDLTDEVVFEVSDEGSGIPDDELESVFERFHQVRSNMVAAKRGAGVGLSIVKGYTELMGGSVEVQSVIEEGSTFRVRLPRARR